MLVAISQCGVECYQASSSTGQAMDMGERPAPNSIEEPEQASFVGSAAMFRHPKIACLLKLCVRVVLLFLTVLAAAFDPQALLITVYTAQVPHFTVCAHAARNEECSSCVPGPSIPAPRGGSICVG
jgi:hypothetical protein